MVPLLKDIHKALEIPRSSFLISQNSPLFSLKLSLTDIISDSLKKTMVEASPLHCFFGKLLALGLEELCLRGNNKVFIIITSTFVIKLILI
jgi:hypothetical protein